MPHVSLAFPVSRSRVSYIWYDMGIGSIYHQPQAVPSPVVSIDDYIGIYTVADSRVYIRCMDVVLVIGNACTYEDMSRWVVDHVHQLGSTSSRFNHHRIGFTTTFAPIAPGLPTQYPVWVKAALAGHSPFAAMS